MFCPNVCLQLSDSFRESKASSSSAITPKLLAMMPSLPNMIKLQGYKMLYKYLDPDVWTTWHRMCCTMRPRSSCREAKRNAERPERSKPKGCQTWQPWTLSMCHAAMPLKFWISIFFCVKATWWELRTTMELKRMNMGTIILNENICRGTSSAFATSTVAPSANSLPNASSGESHIASSCDLQSCQLFTATWNRMVL